MKINMNVPILGLDGQEVPDSNIGKLVAQMLVNSSRGDVLKYWHWAQNLYAGKELDLDPSDSETLKAFIKDHEQMTILLKAQAFACFPTK
jgi:hypothetical protein